MAIVELKSVDKLFGLDFFVPSYQRGYRWTQTQIKELLEDLYDFAVKKKDSDDYYCLQPVVIKKRESEWELVDGQQRLTALWLISALYYCSNKDDVVELVHQKYNLNYEEKAIFTSLFNVISDLLEDTSFRKLPEKLQQYKSGSIDSRNLIESVEYITAFKRNNQTAKGVLYQIFQVISNIKIIWYQLELEEDPIITFTNINANKIELTNAELIKAVILNSIKDPNQMQNIALQWEEIEKGLNDTDFWNYMICEKRKQYSTRIDYLFEIMCAKHGWNADDEIDDRYSVFRILNKKLNEGNSAETIWEEIQEIYDTLRDWYADYSFYHMIGLLLIVNENDKSVEIIKQLYDKYSMSNKTEFKNYIIERIKDIYFSKAKTTPFTEFEFDKIQSDLGDISFSEPGKVKKVLLLYNIALLVNAQNTYERFPFELYKKDTWDIEHINPQSPKDKTIEEKIEWLKSYDQIIGDEGIKSRIDECITNRCIDFEYVANEILKNLDVVENDSIYNLALLDASTNRAYKNQCFLEKRKKIIDIERMKQRDEKYIPIGTKWVFLKGYEKSKQLIVWGHDDMQEYGRDIAEKLYIMLGGTING